MSENNPLRALVDLRERQVLKTRIQFNNRLAALDSGADDAADTRQREVVARWHDIFQTLEAQLDREIKGIVKEHKIYDYVTAVKGIGPATAGKLVAMIDIERAPTVAALWRYAGLGLGKYWKDESGKFVAPQTGYVYKDGGWEQVTPEPKEGWELVRTRDRMIGGYRSPYNKRLKTTCYLIGQSFLKSNSPYRREYDEARIYYDENRDWTAGHCHNAALRKMVKLFLSHLWVVWRSLEGLPTREPYAHEYLDHTTIKRPSEYGWEVENVTY